MIISKKDQDKKNNAKKISNVIMENLIKTNFSFMDAIKAVYSLKDLSIRDYFEIQLDVAARNDSDMTYEKYCSITNFIENGHINQLTINIAWVYILLGIASKQLPTGVVRDRPSTKYLVTIYMILNAMWVNKSLSFHYFHDIYKCFLTDTVVNSHKNQFKIKRIMYALEYLLATYTLSYVDSYTAIGLYLLKNYLVTFVTLFVPYLMYNILTFQFGTFITTTLFMIMFVSIVYIISCRLITYTKIACIDVMREFNTTKTVNNQQHIIKPILNVNKSYNENNEEQFEKLIDSDTDVNDEIDSISNTSTDQDNIKITSNTFNITPLSVDKLSTINITHTPLQSPSISRRKMKWT